MRKPIKAATRWKSNAEMIEACARLGFLNRGWRTLDPTYGGGIWWQKFRPIDLVTHDLEIDGVDFRNLPYPDATFRAIGFDPPYVSAGGRETTTIREFYDRFGLHGAPTSPVSLQALINDGLSEMYRVLKAKGYCLIKCMDYVSSGKLWSGTFETEKHARSQGFEVVDKLIHIKDEGGPQPTNRTKGGKPSKQKHARHNASMLIVLRKK